LDFTVLKIAAAICCNGVNRIDGPAGFVG
jgi:hypothetical protein